MLDRSIVRNISLVNVGTLPRRPVASGRRR